MNSNCKIALAALLALALSARGAQAQTAGAETPQNLVDINPLALIGGDLSVEYERAVSPYATILVGPQVLLFPGLGSTSGITEHGAGLTLAAHFFPLGNALHGFWLGPEVDLDWASVSFNDASGSGLGAGAYGIVGYTFLPTRHFAVSLGVGAGYRFAGVSVTDSNNDTATYSQTGFSFTGRLALGYAW